MATATAAAAPNATDAPYNSSSTLSSSSSSSSAAAPGEPEPEHDVPPSGASPAPESDAATELHHTAASSSWPADATTSTSTIATSPSTAAALADEVQPMAEQQQQHQSSLGADDAAAVSEIGGAVESHNNTSSDPGSAPLEESAASIPAPTSDSDPTTTTTTIVAPHSPASPAASHEAAASSPVPSADTTKQQQQQQSSNLDVDMKAQETLDDPEADGGHRAVGDDHAAMLVVDAADDRAQGNSSGAIGSSSHLNGVSPAPTTSVAPTESAATSTAPVPGEKKRMRLLPELGHQLQQQPPAAAVASSSDATPSAPTAEPAENRLEFLDNMQRIERQFSSLKDRVFRDQIQSLKREYQTIKSGSHEKFADRLEELEQQRAEKIASSKLWLEYQMRSLQASFEAELLQYEQELDSDKHAIRQKMLNHVAEKMKKLEEEKNAMSLSEDFADGGNATRILRRRNAGKEPPREKDERSARRKLQPPHINYSLKESEIFEDINYITKHRPGDVHFDRQRWVALVTPRPSS